MMSLWRRYSHCPHVKDEYPKQSQDFNTDKLSVELALNYPVLLAPGRYTWVQCSRVGLGRIIAWRNEQLLKTHYKTTTLYTLSYLILTKVLWVKYFSPNLVNKETGPNNFNNLWNVKWANIGGDRLEHMSTCLPKFAFPIMGLYYYLMCLNEVCPSWEYSNLKPSRTAFSHGPSHHNCLIAQSRNYGISYSFWAPLYSTMTSKSFMIFWHTVNQVELLFFFFLLILSWRAGIRVSPLPSPQTNLF